MKIERVSLAITWFPSTAAGIATSPILTTMITGSQRISAIWAGL